jgi:hypothetical protein
MEVGPARLLEGTPGLLDLRAMVQCGLQCNKGLVLE